MSLEVSKVERTIGGRTFSIETGKLAKQASGAVLVRYEDTVVLSTVVSADPRIGIDFFSTHGRLPGEDSGGGEVSGGIYETRRPSNH